MFPYFWSQAPIGSINGVNPGVVAGLGDGDLRDLPEDVREAIEAHRDELHSAADLQNLANDQLLRR